MKPSISILFGTMTGNAECCAIDLSRHLQQKGFSCQSENLVRCQAASLAEKEVVLLLVSTWGEGEPPDDAIPFFESLQKLQRGTLSGVRYAVFALGDSSYDVFCGFGKNCDQLLEEAGAVRLRECECCDLDQDERLPIWAEEISTIIADSTPQLVSE
jgi:sulfite reductase alpha subunit-like flavoprotein